MFFTTDEGVNVVQFGEGDILVCAGMLRPEDVDNEHIGSVSLVPRKPHPINSRDLSAGGKPDTDLGVHTRLIFTDIRSIDVLVDELLIAKDIMKSGKIYEDMKRRSLVRILVWIGNNILKLADKLMA